MSFEKQQLKNILEAALLASGQVLSIDRMLSLFVDELQPDRAEVIEALNALAEECESRGVELKQVSSGYRFQARQDYASWVSRLWTEKPPRYSRALLETLVLIAYRQPITRGEIEDVRGVSVSSHIMKSLLERDWVKVVGHRDVPGKPGLYATTKEFLDYFNLKSLEELPTLSEIRDLDKINAELELEQPDVDEAQARDDELLNKDYSEDEKQAEDSAVTNTGENDSVIDDSGSADPDTDDMNNPDAEEDSDTVAERDEPDTEPESSGQQDASEPDDVTEELSATDDSSAESDQDEEQDGAMMYASDAGQAIVIEEPDADVTTMPGEPAEQNSSTIS